MHLFLCFTWHTCGFRNYACQVDVVHYVQPPEALAENVLKKPCSFIRKWWSVKTKSVHEKKGNSEKSFWKKKNACKTKTSNCQNAQFKHLLNEEIKLILTAFSFSSAYFFINSEKTFKLKYRASNTRNPVFSPRSSHAVFPTPKLYTDYIGDTNIQWGWENFPLFSPQIILAWSKKPLAFLSR